ncbi:MAG: transposase [Azoarcus sp.]|nr:transposase [Azoarcus sp.]
MLEPDDPSGGRRANPAWEGGAETFARQPQASIPDACGGWAESKGVYCFFGTGRVGWQDILPPHSVCDCLGIYLDIFCNGDMLWYISLQKGFQSCAKSPNYSLTAVVRRYVCQPPIGSTPGKFSSARIRKPGT